jgi:hypothetical protein
VARHLPKGGHGGTGRPEALANDDTASRFLHDTRRSRNANETTVWSFLCRAEKAGQALGGLLGLVNVHSRLTSTSLPAQGRTGPAGKNNSPKVKSHATAKLGEPASRVSSIHRQTGLQGLTPSKVLTIMTVKIPRAATSVGILWWCYGLTTLRPWLP